MVAAHVGTPAVCQGCGGEFMACRRGVQWCSVRCRERQYRRPVTNPGPYHGQSKGWAKGKQFVPRRLCATCGQAFYAQPKLIRRGGGTYCSRSCCMGRSPDKWPKGGRRGRGGHREDLGFYVRSRWEANWARYLKWQQQQGAVTSWAFEPETFQFEGIKRGSRFYTPDFRVTYPDGRIVYHEVKGYMDARSATKIKRMAKYHPGVKIQVIDQSIYRQVVRNVGGFIPHWEK